MSDFSISGGVAASVAPEDVSPEETTAIFADSTELARHAHAPRLIKILSEDKYRALTLFDEADLKAAEAALELKNEKEHFKCLATGKLKLAKPEEVVRQLWIARLVNHYHYPKTRLAIEFPITFGRDTSKRAGTNQPIPRAWQSAAPRHSAL